MNSKDETRKNELGVRQSTSITPVEQTTELAQNSLGYVTPSSTPPCVTVINFSPTINVNVDAPTTVPVSHSQTDHSDHRNNPDLDSVGGFISGLANILNGIL